MRIRSVLVYPFFLVIVLLGIITVYSAYWYEPGHSPSVILDAQDGVTRLTIAEVMDRATVKPIGVRDVWNDQTYTYGCVELYDLLDVFGALMPADEMWRVTLVNVQGKEVTFTQSEVMQRNVLYLAVTLDDKILEPGFSQSPYAGGPMRMVIREREGTSYGPEYYLWCIYKIIVEGT